MHCGPVHKDDATKVLEFNGQQATGLSVKQLSLSYRPLVCHKFMSGACELLFKLCSFALR